MGPRHVRQSPQALKSDPLTTRTALSCRPQDAATLAALYRGLRPFICPAITAIDRRAEEGAATRHVGSSHGALITYDPIGMFHLKGVPGEWTLHEVA